MADYEATYRGLALGPGTDFELISIEGLLTREVALQTPDLPRYHGGLVGASYHLPRRLVITVDVYGAAFSAALTANRRLLLEAFQPLVDSESPFVFTLPGETAKRVDARVHRGASLVDMNSEVGIARFLIEIAASDPAIYDDALSSETLSPFTSAAGIMWPFTWPISWGAGGSGGGVVVSNSGDWESWPEITINGPSSGTLSNPILENVTTGKTLSLTANGGVDIGSGQSLIVKMHPKSRSVLFATGASRYGRVSGDFWPLPPGNSELRFRASGTTTGASALVEWRSAYI